MYSKLKATITLIVVFVAQILYPQQKLDSLLNVLNNTHQFDKKIEMYLKISKEYSISDLTKAIKYTQDALSLSKHSGNNAYLAKIYLYLGEYQVLQDSIVKGENYFDKAKNYLDLEKRPMEAINAYLSIGNRYVEKDKYSNAMKYYLDGINLSLRSNIEDRLPNLYNNLGVVYLNTSNEGKALEYYTKALDLFRKYNDIYNMAGTTTNIGSIYIRLGQNEIAKRYYEQGYDIFDSIGSLEGMAHSIFKLGMLDLYEDDYYGAIDKLTKSVEIQKRTKILRSGSKSFFLAETYINLGIAYFEIRNYTKAYEYLLDGYNIATNTDQYRLIAQTSEYLSKYYSESSNFKSALEYYKIYKQYSDSILNEESIRNLARVELQNEFNQRLKDEELAQKINIQREKRKSLIYLFISSGLFLLLIIAGLFWRIEKIKKNKTKLEKESLEEKLEHTNKELTTYVMYLLKKNEFIISIAEKLKLARMEAKAENKKVMTDLIKELESNSTSLSWEEFEVRFQKVYTGFYKTLNTKFPDLTPNELRLCAFFRLNMTTKEIAAITYQSINSITVARYRLRKKLGINTDDNLVTFLTKL